MPKIFCSIRKRFVQLTPEEWVRQHVLTFLHEQLDFPQIQTLVEKKIQDMSAVNRLDILIYKKEKPFLLAECKAPEINIAEATLHQTLRYNQQLKAPFIFMSNGKEHRLLEQKVDGKLETKTYAYMQTKWQIEQKNRV